jgi:outer membrane protein assembly factor BamD
MIKNLVLYFALGSLAIFSSSCHKEFTKLQKSGTVEQKYKAAIKYYNDADYYYAGLLFEEISPLLKGDSTAEKTQFYNAYCNYYQSQYQLSSYLFKNFYATYANSPYAEEAFYMYAYSMFKDSPTFNLDQTSTLTAIDALQTFINTFPNSKYADNCTQNLRDLRTRLEKKAYEKAKLYYKTSNVGYPGLANYKAAVITIDNFSKEFPDSPYNMELRYLQIISQYTLADNSIFSKQKERFEKAITLYESFKDKYPTTTYDNELADIYGKSQKGLVKVLDVEEKIKKAKEEYEKEQATLKAEVTTDSN